MTALSPFASLRQTVRLVEWIVLLASLLEGLFSTYFREKPQLLPFFCAYVGIFFLLSCCFPIERSVWQRRTYVAGEIMLILSAFGLQLGFETFLYLVLAKSCLLLRRREVILAVIVLGAGKLVINARTFPARITEIVAQVQTGHAGAVYDLQSILWAEAVSYAGASLFAVCFGFVLVSEHQNRQRAESLAQQVEAQAATLERTRIAREIHDSLGHSLTTLDVQLELAERLADCDRIEANNALAIARQFAKQCLQDVRLSVQTIRQNDFDLNQALQALAEQIQQSYPIRINLNLNLPKLSVQKSHQLYCIVQEGLTNVQKHAQATVVHLSGHALIAEILLELEDDGVGFDPDMIEKGFGLRGMQERIHLLNGQMTIHSVKNQGTQIQVSIPK